MSINFYSIFSYLIGILDVSTNRNLKAFFLINSPYLLMAFMIIFFFWWFSETYTLLF